MQDFEGVLIRAGEVVLDYASGSLEVSTNQFGNKCWSGHLRLPPGRHVVSKEQYLLKLNDGRSGLILTKDLFMGPGSHQAFMRFVGSTILQ
jgi:hypothetical protein